MIECQIIKKNPDQSAPEGSGFSLFVLRSAVAQLVEY